jgi:hypothetical protein
VSPRNADPIPGCERIEPGLRNFASASARRPSAWR